MKSRIISTLVDLQILAMSYYEESLHLQLDQKNSNNLKVPVELAERKSSGDNKENSTQQNNGTLLFTNSYLNENSKPSQRLNMLSVALSKIPQTRKSILSIVELRSILNNMEAFQSPPVNGKNLNYNDVKKIEEIESKEIGTTTGKRSTLSKGSIAKFNFENNEEVNEKYLEKEDSIFIEDKAEFNGVGNGERRETRFRPTMER